MLRTISAARPELLSGTGSIEGTPGYDERDHPGGGWEHSGRRATNSVRHGGGRGRLRVWDDGGSLICEVRDDGVIEDPLVGRVRPTIDEKRGRGLWIVTQLCDLVQLRSSPAGSVARVHMRSRRPPR